MHLVCLGPTQGSVLGPLLFLMYINDIYRMVSEGKIKLFADDTNIFVRGKTLSELGEATNGQSFFINTWLSANKTKRVAPKYGKDMLHCFFSN